MSKPDPAAPLLTAMDLHKVYRLGRKTLEVLQGISLTLSAGEFVAIRGASGAGKSTLLHVLGALDLPSKGTIRFGDADLGRLTGAGLSRFRNQHVGFVFQAYHLLPELSALENVALPARIARRSAAEVERRSRELLARVGLGERLDHRPYELSGGEQQRVAIARALMNDPPLVLADEPTGNLDSHTGEGILDLLCELAGDRQRTVVIATHDARVAARARRTLDLVDGVLQSVAP